VDGSDIGRVEKNKFWQGQLIQTPGNGYGWDDVFLPAGRLSPDTFFFLGHFFGQFHSIVFKLHINFAHEFLLPWINVNFIVLR